MPLDSQSGFDRPPSSDDRPRKRSKWDEPDSGSSQLPDSLLPSQYSSAGILCPPGQKVLMVPEDKKARLIGKGGTMINTIRQDSGAEIKMIQDPGRDAVVTIKGRPEAVEKAEFIIRCKLDEFCNRGEEWKQKVIDVPKDFIGETIGPGGCHLAAMKEKSGCMIKFVQAIDVDPLGDPGKQVCVIKGPSDKIDIAEELLMIRVNKVANIHAKRDSRTFAEMGWDPNLGGMGGAISPQAPAQYYESGQKQMVRQAAEEVCERLGVPGEDYPTAPWEEGTPGDWGGSFGSSSNTWNEPASRGSGQVRNDSGGIEVANFLSGLGLLKYSGAFEKAGFDSMTAVRAMTIDDIQYEIGMTMDETEWMRRALQRCGGTHESIWKGRAVQSF